MDRRRNLWTLGTWLLLIVIAVPAGQAQSKFKTLYAFKGGDDGLRPSGDLIFDKAGNLYSTTFLGGDHGCGTAFELTPNSDGSWTKTVLHSFKCKDGDGPHAPLIFDQAGNLYGTTVWGGALDGGTVFKLSPNQDGSWSESVLYSFTGGNDGAGPSGGVIFDSAGNLYGTTRAGGDRGKCNGFGCGTVFKLTPNGDGSWTESVLHSFCSLRDCSDGDDPLAGLVFDQVGNLYGTTYMAGADGAGNVFKLTPNSDGTWTESVLHTFTWPGKGGIWPLAGLISDQTGSLYGTASMGGDINCQHGMGCGVVFQLTPNGDGTWTERVLYSFTSGNDGLAPSSGLIFDQTGSLYGTTDDGGDVNVCLGLGCGIVFKLEPNSDGGWKETVVHRFVDRPGAYPNSGLVLDRSANLYGTTQGDLSPTTHGSVFEITP